MTAKEQKTLSRFIRKMNRLLDDGDCVIDKLMEFSEKTHCIEVSHTRDGPRIVYSKTMMRK